MKVDEGSRWNEKRNDRLLAESLRITEERGAELVLNRKSQGCCVFISTRRALIAGCSMDCAYEYFVHVDYIHILFVGAQMRSNRGIRRCRTEEELALG